MEKTLDGKRAGLQDAKNLKRELTDFKNKEDQLFAKVTSILSLKNIKLNKNNIGIETEIKRCVYYYSKRAGKKIQFYKFVS